MNCSVLNHVYWIEYRYLTLNYMLFLCVWWWLMLSNKISDSENFWLWYHKYRWQFNQVKYNSCVIYQYLHQCNYKAPVICVKELRFMPFIGRNALFKCKVRIVKYYIDEWGFTWVNLLIYKVWYIAKQRYKCASFYTLTLLSKYPLIPFWYFLFSYWNNGTPAAFSNWNNGTPAAFSHWQ